MLKLLRIVVLAPVALIAFALVVNFEPQSLAQAAKPHQKSTHQGASAAALLTGSDGSTTGVAKFQGNYTVITAPAGQALLLSRGTDCSLTLVTASFAANTYAYTPTGIFSDYERVLHTDAGLTTTPDVFPAGCAAPNTGTSSRPLTFVGNTKSGVSVYVLVGYDFATGSNALYIVSGVSTFTVKTFSFSVAGAVASADLNGDGNADLVVVNNGGLATSGQVFVMLGNADGTFQTAVPYNTAGNTSISAVIDDFNKDGKLDIVAASDTGVISLLTGNGDGTFNAAQSSTPPVPTYPGSTTPSTSILNSLISADLRNSGKKDIIAANGLVLLNDGTGNFTPASSAAFPPQTAATNSGPSLATGDLNKDGKLDLVVSTGANILTYIGKGDGTFSPGLSYATVATDGFVSVSDLDGDGNPDIYVGAANNGLFAGDIDDTNVAYALMGNGDGTFQGAPTIPGIYTGNNLGDVNGDGIPDLVSNYVSPSNQSSLTFTVELGTAKGTFNPVATVTLPATITITSSLFVNPVILSSANASIVSYAVGDLNGDGKADLAFLASYNNSVPVYFVALSNGDGTFAAPIGYGFPQIAPSNGFDITTTVGNLQIADFNHDGKADLIFNFNDIAGPFGNGLYLQGFAVLPGTGNGTTFNAPVFTFTYNSTTPPGTANNAPTVNLTADLNGDGNPDLIATNSSFAITNGFGVITVNLQSYTGKGDGTFNSPTTVLTTNKLGAVVLADFNHDGKLDIAALGEIVSTATNTAQGQFFTALGKGDGTFNAATAVNFSGGDLVPESGLAAGDFDGDGNLDLVYLDANDFSGIYYGKGDGSFVSVPFNGNPAPKDLINIAAGAPVIALDLNKDGKTDVLAGNTILLNISASAPTVVNQANTSTTISAPATTIAQGGSITFTATVTPASGSTIPAGNMTFVDGQTILATVAVDGSGKAIYTTTALAAGSHSIAATFDGSPTFLGSISSFVSVAVTPAAAGIATTTTLITSASSAVAGTSVIFTATVTAASGTAIPTGTITFADAGTTIGTGTLDGTGKATLTNSALTIGSHSITASYNGATTPVAFSNSTSGPVAVTITAAPIVTTGTVLSVSAVNGTAVFGTSLTFTATVTALSGTTMPTGTVTFTDGATTLGTGTLAAATGTLPTAKATFAISTLTVGTHNVAASYGGALTFASSASGTQPLLITAAPASDFSIALSPETATVARSSTATSTITITPIGGFKQSIQIVATGNPAFTTVTTSATSLTPTDGVTPVTATLTLITSTTTISQARRLHLIEFAATLPLGLLGTVLFGLRRRRWSLQLLLVASATILLAATGCGGSSSKSTSTTNTPTPGTYTINVQGTATVGTGTLTHSATYTVTIQ